MASTKETCRTSRYSLQSPKPWDCMLYGASPDPCTAFQVISVAKYGKMLENYTSAKQDILQKRLSSIQLVYRILKTESKSHHIHISFQHSYYHQPVSSVASQNKTPGCRDSSEQQNNCYQNTLSSLVSLIVYQCNASYNH